MTRGSSANPKTLRPPQPATSARDAGNQGNPRASRPGAQGRQARAPEAARQHLPPQPAHTATSDDTRPPARSQSGHEAETPVRAPGLAPPVAVRRWVRGFIRCPAAWRRSFIRCPAVWRRTFNPVSGDESADSYDGLPGQTRMNARIHTVTNARVTSTTQAHEMRHSSGDSRSP